MGVVCVLNYPVPDNKNGSQVVDSLCKRLEALKSEKVGTFSVDCETYHCQLPNIQRSIQVLHSSEYPLSCFTYIEGSSGTSVVADLSFDQIITKLKQFYSKKHPRVEIKGHVYSLSDFKVKIGAVIVGQMTTFKGLLVEIDYQPCTIPNESMGILKEFVNIVFESSTLLDNSSQHFKINLESPQNSTDVMSQYLEHMLNFKISAMASSQNMSYGVTSK